MFVFVGAGLFAFSKLNIEAYPNPAPVILEITAQAPGLSAEEMETLLHDPDGGRTCHPRRGSTVIRSTSFYGLSFVRVTFNYGVDYYFALTQAAINLQQNVSAAATTSRPQIQGSSLVGEIYRYQVVGPPHFGLTNLRTIQDWILQRRLLTVPGVVQVNTWGGTTKEYDVEVDLHKLDAYNVTLPQVITALGNANINVGGRTINFGQQSVNIRGVGLIDSGGAADLTQGYQVERYRERCPDASPTACRSRQGRRQGLGRLCAAARQGRPRPRRRRGRGDRRHEPHAAHQRRACRGSSAEVEKINNDGSLPPGVKLVPFYDRTTLVDVTTHTVMHNLIFGCLLIFIIQWLFLGDLRSAIIVGVNIPFALFFSIIILVLRNEDANLLSVGAVDFGIIVDAAVILVENIYRNFQATPVQRQRCLAARRGPVGHRSDARRALPADRLWTDRLRLIFISALQIDKAVFFSTAIIVAAFIPLFTMQGVEGQIFSPMARTYAYALIGALIATFTVTPCLASLLLPQHSRRSKPSSCAGCAGSIRRCCAGRYNRRNVMVDTRA